MDDLVFLNNPDGYLQFNEKNLIEIINLIREKKPEVVYIPHKSQIRDIKYDEAVRGLNRYRGIMTGEGKYC